MKSGTYVEGVRVDDLLGTVAFTTSNGRMVAAMLTYGQVEALLLELEQLRRDMLRDAAV